MSNKIAVLISGEYRTFDIAITTMPFLQEENVDVYFSTWNQSEQVFPELDLNIVEPITSARIKAALAPKVPKGISLDKHEKYDGSYRYNTKMIDRWQRGLNLIKCSKVQYDYIVVMRPDVAFMYLGRNKHFFRSLNDFHDQINPDVLYTCWNNAATTKRLDDVILIATPGTMHACLGQLSIGEWNESANGDWHDWFWNYTQRLNISTQKIYPAMAMCFCRGTVNPGDDYVTMHQKHVDWANAIIMRDYIRFGEEHILAHWGEAILNEVKNKWH